MTERMRARCSWDIASAIHMSPEALEKFPSVKEPDMILNGVPVFVNHYFPPLLHAVIHYPDGTYDVVADPEFWDKDEPTAPTELFPHG